MIEADEGIRAEIKELKQLHPGLSNDNLFVLWFLHAYIYGSDVAGIERDLCGAQHDGGFDAIGIDAHGKMVHLVQSKLRKQFGKPESSGELQKFINDCSMVCSDDSETLNSLLERVAPLSRDKIKEASRRIVRDGYEPRLYYVTTGKVAGSARENARKLARGRMSGATLEAIGSVELESIYRDYRDDIAPPVPLTSLEVERGNSGLVERFDPNSKIRSWIFAAEARSIAAVYELCKARLFAKNIRGFLGESTNINKAMAKTLKERPDEFFYLNNGVTIICSRAEYISGDVNQLQLWNAQVINGQQTVRAIAARDGRTKTAVLVKVMQVPDRHDHANDQFVSRVVAATNWQNAIKQSDLTANDPVQIGIQTALRKLKYQYIRKRQSKSEARLEAGIAKIQIRREELAQAVAACELDPHETRSGVEHLFETHYAKIFPTKEPYYYLTRWWLRRAVTNEARGDSDSGYAKWLVMSFVWHQLSPLLATRGRKQVFVEQCSSRDAPIWTTMGKAIRKTNIVARQFYLAENRKLKDRLDVSRFYRDKKNLHLAFAKYWRSQANKQRARFQKDRQAIARELSRHA